MPRKTLTASALHAMLEREFKKRRMPECSACNVPLPFYVMADGDSANWSFDRPRRCPHRCHAVISEVLADAWANYDITSPEGVE